MKKYWKSFIICGVIVVTISLFYIQQAIASKEQSLAIETVNGSQSLVEQIEIAADYAENTRYEKYYISKDGSKQPYSNSIIKQFISPYVPIALQQQLKDHRSFMRGKNMYVESFVEYEEQLIYIGFEDNRSQWVDEPVSLIVNILDKQTDEVNKFEVDSMSNNTYNWLRILHVVVVDDAIQVIANLNEQSGEAKIIMFTIDPQQQTIIHEKVLNHIESNTYMWNFNQDQSLVADRYFIYGIEIENHNDNVETTEVDMEIFMYDTQTGEQKTLALPAELAGYSNSVLRQGEYIYIPIKSRNGIALYTYTMDSEQWEEQPLILSYPQTVADEGESFIEVIDDKVYSVYRTEEQYSIVIHEVTTGKLLYEGKITGVIPSDYSSFYVQNIYHIEQ